MEAEDLMIGNYVRCITNGEIHRIKSIGTDDRGDFLGNPYYFTEKAGIDAINLISDLEGIKLSREFLEHNGFHVDNVSTTLGGTVVRYNNPDITDFDFYYCVESNVLCLEDHIKIKMSYVHELQNLLKAMKVRYDFMI